MRRVSVAEAKAHLPELLREADRAPHATIEVTRHGVVVGGIVGAKALKKLLTKRKRDPYRAWLQWRNEIGPGLLGDTDDLARGLDERTPPPFKFE